MADFRFWEHTFFWSTLYTKYQQYLQTIYALSTHYLQVRLDPGEAEAAAADWRDDAYKILDQTEAENVSAVQYSAVQYNT